jgi:hypothetical protein
MRLTGATGIGAMAQTSPLAESDRMGPDCHFPIEGAVATGLLLADPVSYVIVMSVKRPAWTFKVSFPGGRGNGELAATGPARRRSLETVARETDPGI